MNEVPETPLPRTWVARVLGWFFRRLYTTFAFGYDAVAWLSSFGAWDAWRRTALQDLVPGPPLLELGCGTGHLLGQALAAGHQAFSVDASPQMVRITRRRLRRKGYAAVLAHARSQDLPFRSGTFSFCISTFPSEYIFDSLTQAEIHRVLTPEGQLVVVASAQIRPRFPWEVLSRWLYRVTGESPAADERWLDPVRRAGFDVRFKVVSIPGADVLQVVGTPSRSR